MNGTTKDLSTKPQTRPGPEKVVLSFDDNTLLPALFGHHDEHLARLEQALNVDIASRGNVLVIRGPKDVAEAARTVVRHLYQELEAGGSVTIGEVDNAIRMATEQESELLRGGPKARKAKAAETEKAPAGRLSITTKKRVISARSAAQNHYIRELQSNELIFAAGPAGTGKTYLAVAMAVSKLISGEVERIILSRPAVEAGESLGFLPGTMEEKVNPYLRPLYDALYDTMPPEQVVRRIDMGEIEIAPVAFMRGRTLSHAFVILDEAQNTTPVQMKMFLTRLGEQSRMVVTGDPSQVDLLPGMASGLHHAIGLLEGIQGVSVVRFTEKDVIRNPLVRRLIKAYDEEKPARGKPRRP